MNAEQLFKFKELKAKLKINLKDKRFFSGYIKEIESDSLVFIDKFDNEIVIDLESISYIVPVRTEGGNENGNYG